MKGHLTPPPDLAEFWQETLQRTRATPLEVQTETVDEPLPFQKFCLTYQSLDGVPIRAYLNVPLDASSKKRWPLIVTCPGYSGKGWLCLSGDCQRGYAVLQICPRGMGESAQLWQVPRNCENAWINYGKTHARGFYYQGAYIDVVRGIDCALIRPDIDAERVALVSGSGGGLIMLGAGSIETRVKAVVAEQPFLCDFLREPTHINANEYGDENFARTWGYFEPMNLVPFLKTATLLISGGCDTTCPPKTIAAVFERLGGIKALAHFPDQPHGTTSDINGIIWEWISGYLK